MAFGMHHYLGICLEDYGLCLNVTESHPHKYKYFEQRCPSQWNRFSSSAAAAAGSPPETKTQIRLCHNSLKNVDNALPVPFFISE